jgi:catechol 2,3-dioxygenase-like lactoylglutathione lyase family enzyme
MILGAHIILYSRDAEADRAFFRDILGFPSVDAGHGWLIFAMRAAEAAIHPAEDNNRHELYLMCDDLNSEIAALAAKGVNCSDIKEERWGSIVTIQLPGGGNLGLYRPTHPTALSRS